MPLVEVDEPHARPPRVPTVRPGGDWAGSLDLDRGWAELSGVRVDGLAAVDLDGCEELTIADSAVIGSTLAAGPTPEVEIRGSVLDGCDLSGARVRSIRASRLVGCKLGGTDLSDGDLVDVVLQRCVLRYTNLRMARLTRVRFDECRLDEADLFQAEATDVDLDGSALVSVNVDRLRATRVDLRGAVELGLAAVGRLDGCLVADHQLPALAPILAMAVGLDLERPSDPGGTGEWADGTAT